MRLFYNKKDNQSRVTAYQLLNFFKTEPLLLIKKNNKSSKFSQGLKINYK